MTAQLDAKGRTTITLEAVLDVTQAAPLAGALRAVRGKAVVVNAADVQHCGAQCGQILVSAHRTWRTDGQALRVVNPSPGFGESLRLLGLTPLLPLDEPVP